MITETRRPLHKRIIIITLLILAAAGAAAICALADKPASKNPDAVSAKPAADRPVKVVAVKAASDDAARALPGTVQASRRVELAFRVPGQIENLPALEGRAVKKNGLLARLDPTDYRLTVRNLKAQLEGAEARAVEAGLAYERFKSLLADGVTAKAEYDQADAALATARAAVTSLREQLAQAEKNLEYTRLAAPFNGTVALVRAENFENVAAGQPVILFQDVNDLEILVHVPESEISSWRVGREAMATFQSQPGKKFSLAVTEIGAQADPATRTYPVTLSIARTDRPTPPVRPSTPILPGMTAEVFSERGAEAAGRLLVPVSAVFKDGGEAMVWTVDRESMTVRGCPVVLEGPAGDLVAVSGRLRVGDVVAAAGVHYLREGQKIRILNNAEAAR